MVIKTELCSYSEWKIYPGHGQRFVAKDGRSSLYLSRKARVLGLKYARFYAAKLRHRRSSGRPLGAVTTERPTRTTLARRRRRKWD